MTSARKVEVKAFFGAKAIGGIPAAPRLMEEALIQASLDPEIIAIERLALPQARDARSTLDFVILRRAAGRRQVLNIVGPQTPQDATTERKFETEFANLGLEILRRSPADIRREPRFTNCQMVWSCANHRVAVSDRIRIMQMLDDEGPLRVGDFGGDGRFRGDPSAALMALACHDVIELDLVNEVLGPGTNARIRRRDA
jgi:hypothetical protein